MENEMPEITVPGTRQEETSAEVNPTENAIGGQEPVPVAGERKTDREIYDEFISSPRFKRFFTDDTQKIINRRFKEKREERESYERTDRVIEQLKSLSGLDDIENIDTADGEGAIISAFPDAGEDRRSVAYRAKLVGIPAETLYGAYHPELIKRGIAAELNDALVSNIRQRNVRPSENGINSNSAYRPGLNRMTREERREIAERAANGERVVI